MKSVSMVMIVLLSAAIGFTSAQLCHKLGRHLLQHQCVLTPEGTEGPYYLYYPNLIRKDIREDRQGIELRLKFTVTDITKCEPVKNASIDIWQADPFGFYSSYVKNSPDSAPKSVLHAPPTDNTTFLRGIQFTDDNGVAEFITVFPGWYAFRTPHIHLQAHVNGKTVHVAQLYFQNNVNRRITRLSPYKQRSKVAVKNEDDYIFRRDNGDATIIYNLKPIDGKRTSRGLNGEMVLGINPNHESDKPLHGRSNK